ncbi:MAG: LacI family DNA-binding transcriptional regulator [Bacteroidetes bacterium]|nr:LacI family DNA-binding transcriptional regulator [Bacteroidota bacterium]
MKITLQSIAKQLDVSTTTVSRVLSGQGKKYRISPVTEELIRETASDLGYIPDQVAKGLRMRKSYTLGLIIPDISNPFFSMVARSIEREARRGGYAIILSDTQETTQIEIEAIRLLQSRKVDGFIIFPAGGEINHLISLVQTESPVVIADRYSKELKCPFVISDNYRGAFDATTHLLEQNHRNIACIQGRPGTTVSDDRVRGYRDALEQYNIPEHSQLIVGDSFGEANGYVSAKLLLSRDNRPTAFFLCSNLISLGAMRATLEEGLKIPEDISMISFDDQPYSEYLATPMTVVAQQTREMGQIILKLLMAQINDDAPARSEGVVLPTKLIHRKSVKTLRVKQLL